MQTIAMKVVSVRTSAVNYGARFKQLRKARWTGTVLALAQKLGSEYAATIYNIEKDWRVPTLPTLGKHATALGCLPWELLENVETETDRVRALARLPKAEALRAWTALLERYDTSTSRGGSKQKDRRLEALEQRARRGIRRIPK